MIYRDEFDADVPMSAEEKKEARRRYYKDKVDDRRDRYEERAAKAAEESQRRYKAMKSTLAPIPPGQPVLVGHHSERRHRRALDRADNHMRRSIEADSKASHYASKAASVGRGGISSDDPDAIEKLEAKLDRLIASHATNKLINLTWRQYQKKPTGKATLRNLASLSKENQELVKTGTKEYSWHTGPIADHYLTGATAEIRRLKARIQELRDLEETEIPEAVEGDGYVLQVNELTNRVQFIFDGKPSEEVRTFLKRNGFRWARSQAAWQRQRNACGMASAQRVRDFLDAQGS